MKTTDFKFKLPKKLIAKYPNIKRSECRLLILNKLTGLITHCIFSDFLKKLYPGDLLVFNNTRVIPARLYGYTLKGKKVEILIERVLNDYQAIVHIKSSELIQLHSKLILGKNLDVFIHVIKIYSNNYYKLFKIHFDNITSSILEILNKIGHIPIPPYFKRLDNPIDYELYQTIYNKYPGSIAAPTAGLHFDDVLFNRLLILGIEIAFITLHIGSASFRPVRSYFIKDHIMHDEYIEVPKETVKAILCCKKRRNRVIAVGTTVAKSLETASMHARNNLIIEPYCGYSRFFIIPGYHFRIVDALITNFHLPESTLVMLVSAFGGYQNIFNAYNEAINLSYKFLSYGDSMFIIGN